MTTLKLKTILLNLLLEDNTANVVSGNRVDGKIVLRFKEGIEWTAEGLTKEFVKTLPTEAFVVGSKWKFTSEGDFDSVVIPPSTASKTGRGTGSNNKVQIA